jgi:proteic killer suppression protein
VIKRVILSKMAAKQLVKLPRNIRESLDYWTYLVGTIGLHEMRKISGYHDEPIARGAHAGQRSIRLSRAYRAFYLLRSDGTAEFVAIVDINKHVYDR